MGSLNLTGLKRYIKHKFLGREIVVTGQCLQCGSCCRKLYLNIDGTWITSLDQYKKRVKKKPDYARFQCTGRDSDGMLQFSCGWLKQDGSCSDYPRRLNICDSFPEKEMFFKNGELPASCGFTMRQGVPFAKVLKKKMKKKV
ncbi:YkgJ family cysteine cluster protein [Fibrobacterota bacterium]